LVIVANEVDGMYSLTWGDDMDDSIGEYCYVIPRPAGGGTAIGGCKYESWSTEPDLKLAARFMRRAIKVAPSLVPQGASVEALRVIRHQVGWRPEREGGPRIEREVIPDDELGPLKVVHAYGTAGFGYQSSYGVATLAVDLVKSSLEA
jgi:D-amino-acid oxidase